MCRIKIFMGGGRVVGNSERCLKLRMVGVVGGEFIKECFQKRLT